ncbi:hypothetical protein PBOI14_54970 [Pseudomonas sp. Boi14]|nr:hypothetical protein PBOI14_54970 [Pseudomonas sp. Boi14]
MYAESIFSNQLRFQLTLFAWASSFCVLLFMHHSMKMFNTIGNPELFGWFAGSFVLFGIERLVLLTLFQQLMQRGVFLQNAVILGATENGQRLAEYLAQHQDIRSGVTGFIDDRIGRLPKTLCNLPLLGNSSDLERLIREEKVTQVLVALPWSAENRMAYVIRELRRLPVNVLLVPDMVAFRHAHNRITEVANLPMFNASEVPLRGWSPFFKRLEDMVLSSIALVLLSPVMLLVALAIKLDSSGPVLFKQKRYGYNNRLIEVYKFRSMHQHMADAHAEKQTTRATRASPGSGASFARPASMNYPSCSMCSAAACPWSDRAPMPPRPRPPAFSSKRRSRSTPRATGSSRGLPAWRRSTAIGAKPIPWKKSRNVSSSTWNTSKTGRSGSTCTFSSALFHP